MEHSFDVEIAKEYGVNCAVILNNIYFWIQKNEANGNHYHDGMYWTFNSVKAFNDLFPYLSEKQIRLALSKLEAEDIIKTGNYNKVAYDRTKWYAITQKGISILTKRQMEINQKDTPIPDINTNKKTTDKIEPEIPYVAILDYLNKRADTKYRASSKDTQKFIRARWNDGYRLEDFFRVIDTKVKEWKFDSKMAPYLRPSTLFGTKFESYLQQYKPSDTPTENIKYEDAVDEDGNKIVF